LFGLSIEDPSLKHLQLLAQSEYLNIETAPGPKEGAETAKPFMKAIMSLIYSTGMQSAPALTA
jgi:hypothetical protein